MFIGHLALAFGAKRYAPDVSLGLLIVACQLADLVWPTLVLLEVESVRVAPGTTVMTPLDFEHYPYSHSLTALLFWAAVLALFGALRRERRHRARAVAVLAALVASHWVLDVLTHRPDMPLWPGGSTLLGLGLWNLPYLAVPLELLLFGLGVALYRRATVPLDRQGVVALWALVVFLLVVYAANVFGPPPPSAEAVAWSAQALWLLVAWGFWIDAHRGVPR